MDDLEQLTSAAKEALSLLHNDSEAAGLLREAIADHGFRKVVKVPGIVGTCSVCAEPVIRKPGYGAACPCGFVAIPEQALTRLIHAS